MSKLSVGVLLSGRAQFSSYYGGALARWTYEVYSRLKDSVDVTVFGFPTDRRTLYPLSHETSGWWRACSFISQIPILRRHEDFFWLRALMPRLARFEVIHIHNRPQWAPLLRSLGFQGTVVLHLQNDHLGHWTAPMLDGLAPKLDAVILCSTYLRTRFADRSAALAGKTRVIFNGVNTRVFFPREELRESKTIFFTGRLIPEKGPLQLIQAFGQVFKSHPDAKLIVSGSTGFGTHDETDYVKEVRRTTASIQKEHGGAIEFPGYLDHDTDLPTYFQRASLFACPSIFEEPFGLVNAEAMACGTPVVGSRRGGIPEVLADTGRVVDPDDTAQFADVLSHLLSHAEERAALGRATLERCRKTFDWDVIAETWSDFLSEMTGETGSSH